MVRRFCVRPMWLVTLAIFAALAVVQPAAAQSTGVIKGMVVDEKNNPIEGAKVIMEMEPAGGRRTACCLPPRASGRASTSSARP